MRFFLFITLIVLFDAPVLATQAPSKVEHVKSWKQWMTYKNTFIASSIGVLGCVFQKNLKRVDPYIFLGGFIGLLALCSEIYEERSHHEQTNNIAVEKGDNAKKDLHDWIKDKWKDIDVRHNFYKATSMMLIFIILKRAFKQEYVKPEILDYTSAHNFYPINKFGFYKSSHIGFADFNHLLMRKKDSIHPK